MVSMGSSCLAGTLKIFSETTNSNVLLVCTNNVCYVLYKLHIYIYVDYIFLTKSKNYLFSGKEEKVCRRPGRNARFYPKYQS